MTTAELFLKVGMANGNEVRIMDRDGKVIMRAVGAHGLQAIKRMRRLVDALIADAKDKPEGDDVPRGTSESAE